MVDENFDVAIVGAGPAGFSAGIYAGRSGVNSVVFDEGIGGGLAATAPIIDNYPGIPGVSGVELMEKMKQHAEKYCKLHLSEPVKEIHKLDSGGFEVTTEKQTYTVSAIILATGSGHRHLNVAGEGRLAGAGVSYCATCDGFFFKGKDVVVVGGGNTAFSEALFLKELGCSTVKVLHRRDELRAEDAYVEHAKKAGVEILLNTVVEEVLGEQMVSGLRVKNVATNEESVLDCGGVFIAVGVQPNNELAKMLGCSLDDSGFVKVDERMCTGVKSVFAVGDLVGGVRQVVVACSEGATAALKSLEALGRNYPY